MADNVAQSGANADGSPSDSLGGGVYIQKSLLGTSAHLSTGNTILTDNTLPMRRLRAEQ